MQLSVVNFFNVWKTSFSGLSRNIWLLTLVNFVNRLGSMVIVFLPLYLPEIHLNKIDTGLVMSCYGIGSVAGNFIGGKLTDKYGFFWIQTFSLFLNGIVLIVMNYATTFYSLSFMVFMMSFIGDMFRPANSAAVSYFSSSETRTRSFSLIRLAFNLGWTVCPAIGGLLIHLFGWSLMFFVDGITCILASIVVFKIFYNQQVNAERKQEIKEIKKIGKTSVSILKDKPFLYFIFLTFVNAFVFMQLLWTIPVFFKESLSFNEAQVGFMIAINGFIVAMVEMPLVYAIENQRSTTHWIKFGLILYGLSFFMLNLPFWGFAAALISIIGLSFGEILVMPFSSNYVSQKAGMEKMGQYMALYSIAYSVANILAPLAGTSIVANFGYTVLWFFIGTLAFLVYFGFRWVK
ncbi:MAG: MFS transporter [Saprospiraceae bacterium]|nr:MFS transporter [Saprospiraceae bacterium]